MALRFIEDPGHGWLRVPLSEYPDAIESATGHGYWSKDRTAVYLEEDVELADFLIRHPEVSFFDVPWSYVQRFDTSRRERLPRNLTFDQWLAKSRARAS